MTLNSLFSLFGLAILDCLNPATIATMIVLLPLVGKKWHAMVFIFGTFSIYFSAGLLAIFGINKYIFGVLSSFVSTYSTTIALAEISISVMLLIFGAYQSYNLVRQIIAKDIKIKYFMGMAIKKATPISIFVLAIVSTLTDLPTAIPYFGFVGILNGANISIPTMLILFVLYCLIYIAPMIVLYVVYSFVRGEKLLKFENGFKNFINKASVFSIPIILIIFGIGIGLDGINRIL